MAVPRADFQATTIEDTTTVGTAFRHETHAAQSAPSSVTALKAMIEAV